MIFCTTSCYNNNKSWHLEATREPYPGHQLGQGHRLRGDRHRQSHPQLQPGEEVAGAGAGVAAHQDVPLQEDHRGQHAGPRQPPQTRGGCQ